MSELSAEVLDAYQACAFAEDPDCSQCAAFNDLCYFEQPYKRIVGMLTSHIDTLTTEAAAKDATIARLTKPDTHTCLTCVHWGTSMSAYPCLECGQHYDRSDLWEPAEGARDE